MLTPFIVTFAMTAITPSKSAAKVRHLTRTKHATDPSQRSLLEHEIYERRQQQHNRQQLSQECAFQAFVEVPGERGTIVAELGVDATPADLFRAIGLNMNEYDVWYAREKLELDEKTPFTDVGCGAKAALQLTHKFRALSEIIAQGNLNQTFQERTKWNVQYDCPGQSQIDGKTITAVANNGLDNFNFRVDGGGWIYLFTYQGKQVVTFTSMSRKATTLNVDKMMLQRQ